MVVNLFLLSYDSCTEKVQYFMLTMYMKTD